jgi:hypothetical protein
VSETLHTAAPVCVNVEFIHCSHCGIVYGVPEVWANHRKKDNSQFRCPNGHKQCYAPKEDGEQDKPDVNKMRDDLLRATHRAEQAEAAARDAKQQPAAQGRKRARPPKV